MEIVTILEDIEGYTSYTLAGMANCSAPDSLSSPGARMLDSVRDGVVDLIKRGEITLDDFDDNGQLHEVADGGPSIYNTHTLWREFVDLAAYQEEPEFDEDWGTDLNKAAATALYQICSRLAFALADEWRDGWECPACEGDHTSGCTPDECHGELDDQDDSDSPANGPESAGEPLPVRTPGAAMAEVGKPASDVLTGPVDLPAVGAYVPDPLWELIETAHGEDAGRRAARRARLADAAVSRFRWRVWTTAAVLAVIGVSLLMWKGGVW